MNLMRDRDVRSSKTIYEDHFLIIIDHEMIRLK